MAYSLVRPVPRAARVLSLISGACAGAASAATLFSRSSFPPPPGAISVNAALAEARGWSLVTLVVALPLLTVCLLGTRQRGARQRGARQRGAHQRGARSAYLGWLGVLAYLVYTYLELAVSPPFTALYLLYVAAFACAIPALILGVAASERALEPTLAAVLPRRAVAALALASAVFLSLAWLKGILAQTVAGAFGWPSGVDAIGHVVHALDLGLQVPLGIATALLLLRRKPGAVEAGAIFLVNSICMGLALTAMVASSALAAGRSAFEGAPFAVIPIVATALAVWFFRAIELPSPSPVDAYAR
ncbi:MAG TPA: hypothetical protein VFS67_24360 [Polyangiaceae bacterium]|nr:hypothetical protein [Polyangiaceae bacterium]